MDFIGDTPGKPAVLKTSVKSGRGIKELAHIIDKTLTERSISYKERQRKMLEDELRDMVIDILEKKISGMIIHDKRYSNFVEALVKKEVDPYAAAEQLAAGLLKQE